MWVPDSSHLCALPAFFNITKKQGRKNFVLILFRDVFVSQNWCVFYIFRKRCFYPPIPSTMCKNICFRRWRLPLLEVENSKEGENRESYQPNAKFGACWKVSLHCIRICKSLSRITFVIYLMFLSLQASLNIQSHGNRTSKQENHIVFPPWNPREYHKNNVDANISLWFCILSADMVETKEQVEGGGC